MDEFEHGGTLACSDVIDFYGFLDFVFHDTCHSAHVSFGEVDDIDVVANTGAVGGVVVVTEDAEFLADADGSLREEGDEVLGNAVGHLTNNGGGMGTNGVEIAQENGLDGRAAGYGVLNYFLVNLLGVAVG